MDRRIIIVMVVMITGALAFFLYRSLYYKHGGIYYEIRPNGIISVNDSIVYKDRTPGATRWKWDFGDGEYSADKSGEHFFLLPGKFNVTLTVYGPFGTLKDARTFVNVAGRSLASTAEPQINGSADLKVNRPASYTSNIQAESYAWHIEGDPIFQRSEQKGKTAAYSFSRPGTVTLVLTTHNPDLTVQKDITVTAESFVKPTSASPRPRVQHPGQAELPDLGHGVPIDRKQNK